MKEQKETSSVLNDLIETLRDGQEGSGKLLKL
jgi:hypothetical protein